MKNTSCLGLNSPLKRLQSKHCTLVLLCEHQKVKLTSQCLLSPWMKWSEHLPQTKSTVCPSKTKREGTMKQDYWYFTKLLRVNCIVSLHSVGWCSRLAGSKEPWILFLTHFVTIGKLFNFCVSQVSILPGFKGVLYGLLVLKHLEIWRCYRNARLQ